MVCCGHSQMLIEFFCFFGYGQVVCMHLFAQRGARVSDGDDSSILADFPPLAFVFSHLLLAVLYT